MDYYVYEIRNNINDRIYIGVRKINDSRPNLLEDGYLGSGNNIISAVKKYGSESFTKTILEVADKGTCYELEQMIVDDEFVKREDVYNIKRGGEGGSIDRSAETRRKISEAHKGKPKSDEVKRKLSEVAKGRILSEDHKRKISKALKGRTYSEEKRAKYRKPKGPQTRVECPYCGVVGGVSNMTRHHFGNCKNYIKEKE